MCFTVFNTVKHASKSQDLKHIITLHPLPTIEAPLHCQVTCWSVLLAWYAF